MPTAIPSHTAQIGETAGLIWQFLEQNDSISLAKLPKQIDAPRDLVMQAIGWLAREGKLEISDSGRTKTVALSK